MEIGYIRARVYTSDAEIPIENASFSVYSEKDDMMILLGNKKSDVNGNTALIEVEAPDSSLSQSEGNVKPYTVVTVRIDHPQYKSYYVTGVQIFGGQVSIQEAPLIPIDFNIPTDSRVEFYNVTGQNL